MTSFGLWLRGRRTELHLTQAALAERVGCARDVLRQFEAEVKRPSVQLAERLPDALDIPAAERAAFIQSARGDRQNHPARSAAAPKEATSAPARQLRPPRPQVELIGRETERGALQARLRAGGQRLITLIGPGGIGKTSLALQVAADLAADPAFAHDAAVAPLAPLSAVSDVPLAVAEALGESLQGSRSAWDLLLAALRERAVLLVLDNCEHLLGPGDGAAFAALIRQLIEAAPNLQVLATSRERLRLRDERVVKLGGLALPMADTGARVDRADAVRLFVERARRVAPDFALGADNRAAVAQICRRLEGLPLAIELAASWTRVLTPREIAAEIDRSLDFLAASEHDVPARHRSLRAALDHSWQLLGDHERRTLARLSVFRGGFTQDAAQAICAELKMENETLNMASAPQPIFNFQFSILNLLAALVDKSLVQRAESRGAARYTLHELVRQYAEERLAADPAEQQATAARHAAHYAALLQRSIAAQTGGSSPETWANLTRDTDNLRAAWLWAATAGDSAMVLAMARGLMILYDNHGWLLDGAALFERAADALRASGEPSDAACGVALGLQGYFLLRAGQPLAGATLLEEGLGLMQGAGVPAGFADLPLHLATVEYYAARFATAQDRFAQAARLAEASGDHFTRLWATYFQGVIALFVGELPAAERNLVECLDAWRSQSYSRGLASALNLLGETAHLAGRPAAAEAYVRESLQIASATRDQLAIALCLRTLAALALEHGDLDQARYMIVESCAGLRAQGDLWLYGRSRAVLMRLEAQCGEHTAARQGCAELLRLARKDLALLLPEAAYGLALLLVAAGSDQEALAVLTALADTPGEHATLALCTRMRADLERRLDPAQRAAAQALARARQLLPWLEELCARLAASVALTAPMPSEDGAPIVPAGALHVAETGETLSPREVEVLRLVARGASNPDIAARLIISPHTVKRHVANICQKLSVATRTEAAVRARELGIVG